ncbi:MAG: hypothetical protein GX589_00945 [Deltaproteobacteria bacterium]|nr:hypothetical protein [Deltaproteobacteria bacterium]
MGLIAMAHRTTYVLQSGTNAAGHMIGGFIQGLMQRTPAIFNIYCACQPEHGIPDDAGKRQAKLAMESRAYPFFKYNPVKGDMPNECLDLSGNPSPNQDWHTYTLKYTEDGEVKSMQLPLTFADFALTEGRFRKHFKRAPRDTWNENMVPVAEFVDMEIEARQGKVPYIWTVDKKNQLSRVLVAKPVIDACEDRRHFWRTLKALSSSGLKAD